MRVRRILLLLVILGFGGVVETAWSVRNHGGLRLGPDGCRALGGKSYSFESSERVSVPAGTAVAVDNSFGSVHIAAGEAGETRVTLRKVVFEEQDAARSFADRILIVKSLEGGTLRLGTNRGSLDDRTSFETHLDVVVPPQTAVTVTNEHGRIEVVDVAAADLNGSFDDLVVERVAGAAQIINRHGDIRIRDVKGALGVTARYGDATVENAAQAVTLSIEHGDATVRDAGSLVLSGSHGSLHAVHVTGDLQIRAEHAEVEAREIGGAADIETSYKDVKLAQVAGEARIKTLHGAIDASDLKGGARVEASYDNVTLERVTGLAEITVEHGSASASGLRGGARVRASGDDVTLEDFVGPVDIQAEHANLRLTPGAPLTGSLIASTTNGSIELEVTAGSTFNLQASVRSGDLQFDVPGLEVLQSDPTSVSARMGGGGSAVKLTADHGDVEIKAAAARAGRSDAKANSRR